MQTFLTHEKQSQREFSVYIKKTEKAIRKAFKKSFGAAYSGLTPQELAIAIKTDTILPEKGMGFDKVLALAQKTVLNSTRLLLRSMKLACLIFFQK